MMMGLEAHGYEKLWDQKSVGTETTMLGLEACRNKKYHLEMELFGN